ncbi:SymE family type I addiction module toxin [Scandinavium goeteborgense]|uniref:SymE family type I addiction module toxin n=1 Tax=Scandinavium goeteborgense TaxID=1851514 RepID=UPI001414ED8D
MARVDKHAVAHHREIFLGNQVRTADMHLNGRWMEEAGFTTSINLDIRVMPGCLVRTAQDPEPTPPPEPEIMQTRKKVCKLSGCKQQILEFIEVITAKTRSVERWG